MNRSWEGRMPLPFTQGNPSSSSLEGMERPVRSFKSFIKTVPPHPKPSQKPLPPTPSQGTEPSSTNNKSPSPPSSTPPPASPNRASCVVSWKAPADWYNEGSIVDNPLVTPPIPAVRSYSPLLPEPSLGISHMEAEPPLWQGSSPPSSRLLPIYERPHGSSGLRPPRSPPRSPLPAPPTVRDRPTEKVLCTGSRDAGKYHEDQKITPLSNSELHNHHTCRTNYAHASSTSSTPTSGKAYTSLVVDSPRKHAGILENKVYEPESIPAMERTRADPRCLRRKNLQALNTGSLLSDDSWEDMDMDDKTRQLSFSQDYHDLLADQYQEMCIGNAQHQEPKPKVSPKDHNLVPQPLTWQKEPGRSTPCNPPEPKVDGASSASAMHKRIISMVPHRLSVVTRRESRSEPSGAKQNDRSKPNTAGVLRQDLRFSRFFSTKRSVKQGKKNQGHGGPTPVEALVSAASHPRTSPPPGQSSGGRPVLTQSPSPDSRLAAASVQGTSLVSDRSRSLSQPASELSHMSNSDHCSSFNSRNSQSPITHGVPVRNLFRFSVDSSRSHHSSMSGPSHPLAQEVSRSPQALPPVHISPHHSPPLSPDAWKWWKSHSHDKEGRRKPGFIVKAREARHKHSKEVRQKKLKRSIKVIGPTDPSVAAGYVKMEGRPSAAGEIDGRLPGYMVTGPI